MPDACWLGHALRAVFRPRADEQHAIDTIHAVAARIDERTDTIASALEAISGKLKA